VATVAFDFMLPAVGHGKALDHGACRHVELGRDGRITGIVWTLSVPPGEFAEFAFIARNPRDKSEIVWTLRQRFADGTVSDWTKGPNGVRPTAVTKLTPRPVQ
jgi:hypothetical protein